MKRLHADPEFAAKQAAASENMKRLHADPEFKAATSERMKQRHESDAGKGDHTTTSVR